MISRAAFAPLAIILLLGCEASSPDQSISPDPAKPPFPAGLFGNVCMSELTGDLAGMEVRLFEQADRPMAEFVLCEGWCNETFVSAVERDGESFRFGHVEELLGDSVSRHQVDYLMTPEGAGYRLRSWYDGAELPWGEGGMIRPLSEPVGLAVARDEADWSAPVCST